MRVLKALAIFVFVIVVLFLLIAAFLPSNVHVKESIEINAPVNIVFEQVRDFNNWAKWSPFQENDPGMITTIEGKTAGVGAMMTWVSRDGNGSLNLIEVIQNICVKGELNYEGMNKSYIDFEFETIPQGTMVTWGLDVMDLPYPFGRWRGVFIGNKMKPDFQQGLNNLKSICETVILVSGNKWRTSEVVEKEVVPVLAFSIKDSCTMDNFSAKFEEIYGAINEYMHKMKVEQSGYPFCVYYTWNPEGVTVFEAGIPISKSVNGKGRIILSELPGAKVLMVSHFGPYESIDGAHNAIDKYMKEKNKVCNGSPWEVYVTDTRKEPDTAKWETQVYYPIE